VASPQYLTGIACDINSPVSIFGSTPRSNLAPRSKSSDAHYIDSNVLLDLSIFPRAHELGFGAVRLDQLFAPSGAVGSLAAWWTGGRT
jgi:hypothetical protein